MIENYFSTAAMALETAITLFLTTFFLLKRRKQSVGCYIGVFLALLTYMEVYEFAMRFHGTKIWFFGGLIEILAFVLLITVMTEGCFWRSYCILVLTQGVTQVVWQVLALPFPTVRHVIRSQLSFMPAPIPDTCVSIFGVSSLSFVIAFLVMRRAFSKEYEGNGKVYERIMIVYIIISYISLASREKLIDRIQKGEVENYTMVLLVAVWITFLILLCNVVPYVYNQTELAWTKKQQKYLETLLAESGTHYEELVKLPMEMGRPLSGILTLDAVITDYVRQAKERGIMFDIVVEPLGTVGIDGLELTAITDTLLRQAFTEVADDTESFVQLTIRNRCGSVIFDVDYSAHKRKKKKPEGIVPIDTLVNKYGGTFRRRKTKQEIKVGVLIPAISVNKI